ncbi:short-chain dehydrogenase/reductase SDR [Nitrosococcus halophilus Nc 4]|uniref:Short-chain dehydrogenase/reductase SDR n=1 Tax=Nitrosococcus halophilus (strain Nc4) TaxID=472759 RepID=D5C0S3_NITHN|nr:SDR family oxidoreductase [Nitrosococcus halophilus]ADE16396.1 short-chain dehydrogenase/reductase SDR [Nitrosococcus halophilus Nc 4]
MPSLLITGANRGIGLEFAKQYAKAGWRVLACCRHPDKAEALEQLASQHEGLLNLHALDVANFDQIDSLAADLADEKIDLLVNNAAIYPDTDQRGFGSTDYQAWMHAFCVNSMAPLKMAEAFVNQIASSQQKKIVCITSKMGSIADNTRGGCYLYRSSKAALNMVVKSLSVDLAPQGIIAASLHPGWVKTDMGGPHALITTQESVAGMRQVIEQLTPAQSGKFYAYDGQEIPW